MEKARVLIVENELLVARDIQRSLESQGHSVTGVAATAEEAVRMASETSPNLLLMDISLGGDSDGIDAAAAILAGCNLPLVYLTSYDDENTIERARATGPMGYIIKPFVERELGLTIEMALYKFRASDELRKANRALKTLSGCNKAMSQAGSVQDLLREVCRIIVEDGGYGLAWVGLRDGERENYIHPAAVTGEDYGCLSDRELSLSEGPMQKSPVAAAIKTGLPVTYQRSSTEKRCECPEKNTSDFDYASCIALPLASGKRVFGVLNIYSREPGAFDADEFDLLAELSGNLSYGMVSIWTRAERRRAYELMRKSEEKYKNLVELTADMIYQVDADGNVTFMNDSAFKLLEAYPGEVLGRPFILWVHPDDREGTLGKLSEMVEQNTDVYNFENRLISKKGREICFLHNLRVIRDQDGRVTGTQGIARDFTKRKLADEALEESEETLRTITGTAKDAIVMIDEDGTVSFWNPAAEKIFGYTYGEIIGKDIHLIISPEKYLQAFMRGFRRFVEDETGPAVGRTVELTAVRKDGKEIPIELSLSSIQIKGRWNSVGIIRDITERKEVEEQLRVHREELADLVEERTAELKREIAERDRARAEARERETMLRTLFEEALNPVMITDEVGLFIDANRAALEFLECDLQRLQKNDVWAFLPAENMDYIDSDAMPFFDSKTLETEYSAGTRKKTLLLNIVPVTVSGKKLLFFIGQEITERKKLHEELMKAQKLESVGVLAGGIAHDFNNILTSILSNISLAKLSLDRDGRTYRLLYEAEKASLRARDLTQQLLTFSKGGSPVKKTASIERTLRDSADFALRGSNVRCEYHIQDGLWPVDIDEGQISQAVSNLIINADHSMPEGGIISVKAENMVRGPNDLPHLESGRYVLVSIKDNGTGIPPRHMDKIFDPYFTTKHEGSGLGLTTTYSIIKNHGGYVTVDSELGAGTVFRLYLPASERKFEATPEVEEKIFAGRGRILVMDDDEDIRHSVAEALRLFGYEVCFACDGTETINMYKKEMDSGRGFDAIIMDLTVPGGMGGVEAIARLRQIDPGLKALASSGYSNSPVMSDYKKYGFAGVITKPYKIEELSKALHDVVTE